MKKLIAIISIIALMFSMSVCAFGTEKEDIFYYDLDSDLKLRETIKSHESDRLYFASYYLTQHLKYTGKVEESKFTFHTEKAYAEYDWTYENMIEFIKADNKEEFLKKLKLKFVIYPVSYDSEIIYNFYDVYKFDYETKNFEQATYAHTITSYNLTDKQEAERILKADGFEGYEVLQTVSIGGNWFILAQKDRETVAVYVSFDRMNVPEMFSGIPSEYNNTETVLYKTYKETFDNKIFTADDLEKLDTLTKKIIEENEKNEPNPEEFILGSGGGVSGINTDTSVEADSTTSTVGGVDDTSVGTSVEADDKTEASGAVTTGELLAEDDGEGSAKPFPWKYVGIGAGVVVLLGVLALVLVLVLKKKKA